MSHSQTNAMSSLVVISPEEERPDELAVVAELFAAGLERYHVRKPRWSAAQLEAWVAGVPACRRPRLVLHQGHELVGRLGLGGRHWRDEPGALGSDAEVQAARHAGVFTSRSCHGLDTLRAALGAYDAVFFGPVCASLSKPGYGPRSDDLGETAGAILRRRTGLERQTRVIALGGITVETAPRVIALGFDGVAVLGAVWMAPDPVVAFGALQRAVVAARQPGRIPDSADQFAPSSARCAAVAGVDRASPERCAPTGLTV